MFGLVRQTPQNEETPFYPRSPYGVAKVYAYWMTVNYREAYDLFAVNGILFNHESPRRGETFVSRKITRAVGRIKHGLQDTLYLGNLDARRDWGYAKDYVEAMWLMLQHSEPQDFVIATGKTHTVRDFCALAFSAAGIELEWRGEGFDECGVDGSGAVRVRIDPRYLRPTEVDLLLGDATKAREVLGWTPQTDFQTLVELMTATDLQLAADEAHLKQR
jgi:GDPmannose 4,6-dehydratase